jgi:hypothetical protein
MLVQNILLKETFSFHCHSSHFLFLLKKHLMFYAEQFNEMTLCELRDRSSGGVRKIQ